MTRALTSKRKGPAKAGSVVVFLHGYGADGADLLVAPGTLRGPADVDAGLAGTVLRFLPPVAALATGPVRLDGDPRLRERPNAGLIGRRDGACCAARSPASPPLWRWKPAC